MLHDLICEVIYVTSIVLLFMYALGAFDKRKD